MLYYLLFSIASAMLLSFFKVLPYNPANIFASGVFLVSVSYVSNKLLAFLVKTKTNLESRSITALILTLIIGPVALVPNLKFLTVAAIAAMASKYLLVYKNRHVFNPAAFGILASAIVLGEPASWWISSKHLLPFVLLGGLIVLKRLRRLNMVLGFTAVYLILTNFNLEGFFFSPLPFFTLVMLVEPLTAPQDRKWRMYFGAAVAVVLVFLHKFLPTVPYSLELSLLIGNLAFRILNPDVRLDLTLVKKEQLDANIYGFWFEPVKKFSFVAGQFLEWTLPHSWPDSRGTRRYFTIASSPTEENLLLATRFFGEQSSSYKKALTRLKQGDKIVVSNREGEFVLPKDEKIPVAYIAGGIGVTPFRSITRFLLDSHQSRDIVMLYSNRNAQGIVFKNIFDEAAKKFAMRTVYINADKDGMIDATRIKKEITDWRQRIFYVSGPESMVSDLEKMLYGMGLPKRQVKTDYFPGVAF